MEFKRYDIVRVKKNVALDDFWFRSGDEFVVIKFREHRICCETRDGSKTRYFFPSQLELVSRGAPVKEYRGFTEDEIWAFLEPKVKEFIGENYVRPVEKEMLIAIYRAGYNRGKKNKPFVGGNVKENNYA